MRRGWWSVFLIMLLGCTAQPQSVDQITADKIEPDEIAAEESGTDSTADIDEAQINEAQIVDVVASGDNGAYTLAVTVLSPDSGCETYANWWEVVSPEGTLLYRRILAHSHVDEQPFTRSGGPIAIEANQPIIVRVHMHPTGYSLLAMKGSPSEGFTAEVLPASFGTALADAEPQPNECAF